MGRQPTVYAAKDSYSDCKLWAPHCVACAAVAQKLNGWAECEWDHTGRLIPKFLVRVERWLLPCSQLAPPWFLSSYSLGPLVGPHWGPHQDPMVGL